MNKKWPVIYFFSDDFWVKEPLRSKTVSNESDTTSIVARISFQTPPPKKKSWYKSKFFYPHMSGVRC